MLSEYILIGQILRPQGIKGLVKVRPDTNDPERFYDLDFVYRQTGETYEKLAVCDVAVRDQNVFLRVEDDQTRDDAEKRRDIMLYVDRANAVQLEENEYFICDLVGCRVVDQKGNEIGQLVEILQPGANDVYVVKTPKGNLLVPAINRVVVATDIDKQEITLNEDTLFEVSIYE